MVISTYHAPHWSAALVRMTLQALRSASCRLFDFCTSNKVQGSQSGCESLKHNFRLMRRAEKGAPSCEETALGPSRGRMRKPLQSVSHFARSHDPGAGPRPWPLLQIRRAAVTVYDKLAFLCSVIFLPAYDKFESLEMRS